MTTIKPIGAIKVISDDSRMGFERELERVITNMQNEGYDVEIKYSAMEKGHYLYHCAVVTGRA